MKMYTFDDLKTIKTWNYEKPTSVEPERFVQRIPWREAESFWNAFVLRYPIFKDVSLEGLAIVGGCIVDLLISRSPKDIDLFFVPEANCKQPGKALAERCRKFVKEIYQWIVENNKRHKELQDEGKKVNFRMYSLSDLVITRHKATYTIKVPCCDAPIQISLCTSIAEMFLQVDIAPTQIAYFKGEIQISEAAKFSLENMAFEVDFRNNSIKYLHRIVKYFNKGFDVILPDLAVEKLDQRNLKFHQKEVLDLPFLNIVYSAIRGNKIEVYSMELSPDYRPEDSSESIPNYSSQSGGAKLGVIIHHSIHNLIRGEYDKFTYYGAGELCAAVFHPDLDITERMINNTYETFLKNVFKKGVPNLHLMERFISVKKISDVLNEVLVQYAKDHADQAVIFNQKYNQHVRLYFENLVAEQIAATKRMILNLAGKATLEYCPPEMSERQLGKKDWYGEYLLC